MMKIGNCPDSWGVLFPDDPKQMTWERLLDEFVADGYHYLEMGPYGYFPKDAAYLKDVLASKDVKAVSGAVVGKFDCQLDECRKKLKEVGPYLKALGAEYLVTLEARYSERDTRVLTSPADLLIGEFDAFCKNLTAFHKEVYEEYGLTPVFHPHADTHFETEIQIAHLLDNTDPDLVSLCFDTGHHVIAGGEAVAFMRRYGGRTKFMHIKNVNGLIKTPVIEKRVGNFESIAMGIYSDLSTGEIDLVELKKVMESWGYDGYLIIEQDAYPINLNAPADAYHNPLKTQLRNAEYLEQIGFGHR